MVIKQGKPSVNEEHNCAAALRNFLIIRLENAPANEHHQEVASFVYAREIKRNVNWFGYEYYF